jgi:hypothetical protein
MLDMSDIVSDPLFADTFDVIRTTIVTGNNGRATPTETPTHNVVGTVTQGAGDELKREAVGERIEGNITIHTTFPLQAGEQGKTADIVVWPAGSQNRYVVMLTSDYTRLGGFVAAQCSRTAIVPPAD